jgi:ribonuclease Z
MTHVIVLGSGTPNAEPGRAGSAVAVVDGSSWVLVDCGRGATQRALDAGLRLGDLVAVYVTHHHSDHISDLATLAIARWVAGGGPLVVVAPAGPATEYAARAVDAFAASSFVGQAKAASGAAPSIAVVGFTAGPTVEPVWSSDGWSVSSTLVDHGVVEPAVGYRIERGAARVMVSGDTRVCDGVRALADRAHVVVHEALLGDRVSAAALEWNASARDVGELARLTNPRTLVLTHLIPAPATEQDEAAYVADVRAGGFEGTTLVARDLLRIDVHQDHDRDGV